MDFSEKPQVDISSIAGVLQRQAALQSQAEQQYAQQKEQAISNGMTGIIQGAQSAIQSSIAASKEQQRQDFIKNLGDAMAASVPPVMQTLPTQGPAAPDYSNMQPVSPAGNVSDLTSQFPGAQGQGMNSQPAAGPALPPQTVSTPNFTQMNGVRAAAALAPDQAAQDFMKTSNPSAASAYEIKQTVLPDGTVGYARVNKLNPNDVQPINGLTSNAITPAQRKAQLAIAQENADTRGENANTNQSRFVSVMGNKFADATDPSKMTDYSRLTAAKRLGVFADQVGDKAIGIQVKEAAGMLASIMQGGGKGGVVAEKLIDQLTPSTVKGSAMTKLQWLQGHPESVDQGEFLKMFKQTADREATAAENNIRQHQVDAINKYGKKVKSLDPIRYNNVLSGTGLSEDNVGSDGSFVRTPNLRSILPDYNAAGAGQGTQIPGLPKGFTYTVQ